MDEPTNPTCVVDPKRSIKSVCRPSSPVFNIFRDLRTSPLVGSFLPAGHSVLGLLAFEPAYDRMYWLRDRRWRGDNCSGESRVRNTQWLFYGWHNLEFFDMPSRLRPKYYIRAPPQRSYRDVPRSLFVPMPSVLGVSREFGPSEESPPRVSLANRCRRVGRIVRQGLPSRRPLRDSVERQQP